MSESNNVKFVEVNGKWVWKCYDEQGSVTYRSPEFDSEALAKEDYEIKRDQSSASAALQAKDINENTPNAEQSNTAGNVVPEGDTSAGSSSSEVDPALQKTVGESANTLNNPNA